MFFSQKKFKKKRGGGGEKWRRDDGKTIGCADAFENQHVIHHHKKYTNHIHTHTPMRSELQIYYEFFYCHTRSRKSLNPLATVSQPFSPTKVSIMVAVKDYIYILYIVSVCGIVPL